MVPSKPADSHQTRSENSSRAVPNARLNRLPLPPLKPSNEASADPLEPGLVSSSKASTAQSNPLTLAEVERTGVLGRNRSWLKAVMDRSHWVPKQRESDDMGPTFINGNGVAMTFTIVGQQVYGASVTFPPKAVSADMTALSEFFIGQSGHFPLHWEALKPGHAVHRQGRFDNARGQTLYYRGQLRESGEPPFGPARLELSLAPFGGQTFSPVQGKTEMQELLDGPR